MTHIRIRASLGGNIPRMSKILPVPRDAFVFLLHALLRSHHTQLFVFLSPKITSARISGGSLSGSRIIPAHTKLWSHRHHASTLAR
jgi:hypothetical protein